VSREPAGGGGHSETAEALLRGESTRRSRRPSWTFPAWCNHTTSAKELTAVAMHSLRELPIATDPNTARSHYASGQPFFASKSLNRHLV
jgi:hypothetical protein